MSSSPRRVRAVLLCLFLGLVAGCGGGGAGGGAAGGAAGGGAGGGGAGGGGAGGGAGGGGGPAPSGAIYSGSEAEAALTPTNAGRFLQAAFGTADLAGTFIGYDVRAASGFARDDDSAAVSAAQGGSSALGAVLRLLQVPTPSPGRVKAGAEGVGALANVNENDTCDGRGGVFTTGDVDANGVGTVTLRFDNCADSLTGVTITGEVQFRILARNEPGGIVTRGEYTLRGLDVRGAGNVLVDGRIGIVADVAAQQRTFTLDVSWREEGVRPTIDYRGLVLTYVVPPVGDVRAPTISMRGRIYLADLGFATVRAEQAFIVARTGTEFPLAGGPLLFDGAGASRLEVTANVDEAADMRLDADGNGAFEHRARVSWPLLLQPLGSDIADRDGDGLHDSWETAYGLDPRNAADAGADADGDGFTNAEEYRKVTPANDAVRRPFNRTDGAIDIRSAPTRTAVGSDITYEVRLRNLGPSPNATNVQVRGLLANATLLSVDPADDTRCVLAGAQLRCAVGRLALAREHILRINARAGSVPATARLALALYVEQVDAAPGNDTAEATTAIE